MHHPLGVQAMPLSSSSPPRFGLPWMIQELPACHPAMRVESPAAPTIVHDRTVLQATLSRTRCARVEVGFAMGDHFCPFHLATAVSTVPTPSTTKQSELE